MLLCQGHSSEEVTDVSWKVFCDLGVEEKSGSFFPGKATPHRTNQQHPVKGRYGQAEEADQRGQGQGEPG